MKAARYYGAKVLIAQFHTFKAEAGLLQDIRVEDVPGNFGVDQYCIVDDIL